MHTLGGTGGRLRGQRARPRASGSPLTTHRRLRRRAAGVVGGAGLAEERTASTVRWTNPSERFAPIARAVYELCPASADSSNPTWRREPATLHLEVAERQPPDDDRQSSPSRARACGCCGGCGCRTPPATRTPAAGGQGQRAGLRRHAADRRRLRRRAPRRSRPAESACRRQRVRDHRRRDRGAPRRRAALAAAERPRSARSGLTATIDDEVLRKGVYDLRAVAVNGAGLQQGTNRRSDGLPARIKLPIRRAQPPCGRERAGKTCRRVRTAAPRARRVCRARLKARRACASAARPCCAAASPSPARRRRAAA